MKALGVAGEQKATRQQLRYEIETVLVYRKNADAVTAHILGADNVGSVRTLSARL